MVDAVASPRVLLSESQVAGIRGNICWQTLRERRTPASQVVERIKYDSNRSAFVALAKHAKKCKAVKDKKRPDRYAYMLCPQGTKLGSDVQASRMDPVELKPGSAKPLKRIPIGAKLPAIELNTRARRETVSKSRYIC